MLTTQADRAGRPVKCIHSVLIVSLIAVAGFHAVARDGGEKPETEDRVALNATWDGLWVSPTRGYIYTAEMHLKVDRSNAVRGHIQWTRQSSPRASEQAEAGLTGVEYVVGKYDPSCRILSIEGERLDDPHTILSLDEYRLILAENRIALGGITKSHGTWRGMFSLGRRTSPDS